MATNNGGQPQQQPAEGMPQLNVIAQYTKDFSFENPNAPRALQQQPGQTPSINIQINVTPKQLTPTDYEVELKLEGKAETAGTLVFGFELVYAGVFRLQNIPQENLGAIVMIECPRLLFPFARELVAGAVVSGGYPPLMLDPVDFVALYRQKMSEAAAQQPAAATTA
ncbi:MAG: protein-export chaperone SecB [Xanthobacteraceae bacterium]